jgi:hypothetical protein
MRRTVGLLAEEAKAVIVRDSADMAMPAADGISLAHQSATEQSFGLSSTCTPV